jgi:hypothetical protein
MIGQKSVTTEGLYSVLLSHIPHHNTQHTTPQTTPQTTRTKIKNVVKHKMSTPQEVGALHEIYISSD